MPLHGHSNEYQLHMGRHMTKSTEWLVRPANIQISMGIHPVAVPFMGSLTPNHVDSEDSDQTIKYHFPK